MGQTANERAYEMLRDLLVSVRIAPGEMLTDYELSDRLQLGRAAIRDALRRLAQDRLVVVHPRRGTFASEIKISDARWLTEVREPLEGLAARLATQRCGPKERDRLQELQERLRTPFDAFEGTDLDREIHRTIYAFSGNPHLEATLNQYLNLGIRIWYFCLDRFSEVEQHVFAQAAILDAITSGEAALAERLASGHVRRFLADVQDHL